MIAIVEIAGKQYNVSKGKELYVNKLDEEVGKKINFDKVLLISDDKGKTKVGTPTVEKSVVTAKVIEHLQGDKITVFKKKRRKGYKVKNGHRDQLTKLSIESIK